MPKPTKYRKRPVEVEAMQWDGSRESIDAICRWANDPLLVHGDEPVVSYVYQGEDDVQDVIVWTLNGDVGLDPGEWVVRGVQGEFYPCKPDIFDATYEPIPVQGEQQ
jgi:hypothetical protein